MGLAAAAAVGAVGAVASAGIANKGASKAAKATTAAADQSASVQRDIYGQNQATLSPFVNAGLPATQAINSLLGLGSGQPAPQQPAQQMPGTFPSPFGGMGGMNAMGGYNQFDPQPAQPVQAAQPAPDANQAFANYRNSTGYQFRLGEGLDAVNSGYAGAGTIRSGAAMKAINDYGQGMASQEFGNYLNSLGNQQAVGLSAGSALAGVGQNYANSLGNIYQAKGDNLANAALLKSKNTAGAINSIADIGGSYFGRGGF